MHSCSFPFASLPQTHVSAESWGDGCASGQPQLVRYFSSVDSFSSCPSSAGIPFLFRNSGFPLPVPKVREFASLSALGCAFFRAFTDLSFVFSVCAPSTPSGGRLHKEEGEDVSLSALFPFDAWLRYRRRQGGSASLAFRSVCGCTKAAVVMHFVYPHILSSSLKGWDVTPCTSSLRGLSAFAIGKRKIEYLRMKPISPRSILLHRFAPFLALSVRRDAACTFGPNGRRGYPPFCIYPCSSCRWEDARASRTSPFYLPRHGMRVLAFLIALFMPVAHHKPLQHTFPAFLLRFYFSSEPCTHGEGRSWQAISL
eukprot:RCo046105